jgi:hypothetical protein
MWTAQSRNVFDASWTMPDFRKVLGVCSLSGSLSQEPHSDGISSWQDSIWGLGQNEVLLEWSPCFWMVDFHSIAKKISKTQDHRATSNIFVRYSLGTTSAKNISVRAEWLRQSGLAPSEPSEIPRWLITPRPAFIATHRVADCPLNAVSLFLLALSVS